MVGVPPPRVASTDQFVDGGTGQKLRSGLPLCVRHLMTGSPSRTIKDHHRVNEGARPVLEEARLQRGHRCTEPSPGLVKVRGIDGQIRAQGARHAAHAGHRQVGGRLGAHTVG